MPGGGHIKAEVNGAVREIHADRRMMIPAPILEKMQWKVGTLIEFIPYLDHIIIRPYKPSAQPTDYSKF